MENLAEIKTVHSPRKLDCPQELLDLFCEVICLILEKTLSKFWL